MAVGDPPTDLRHKTVVLPCSQERESSSTITGLEGLLRGLYSVACGGRPHSSMEGDSRALGNAVERRLRQLVQDSEALAGGQADLEVCGGARTSGGRLPAGSSDCDLHPLISLPSP